MIVTEAFGGAVGAAAASSYSLTDPGKLAPVSGSVARHPQRGVLGGSHQRRPLRLRNQLRRRNDLELRDRRATADSELRDAVAGSTRLGEKGIRDEAITRDGSYLYAIDADAQKLFGWTVAEQRRAGLDRSVRRRPGDRRRACRELNDTITRP